MKTIEIPVESEHCEKAVVTEHFVVAVIPQGKWAPLSGGVQYDHDRYHLVPISRVARGFVSSFNQGSLSEVETTRGNIVSLRLSRQAQTFPAEHFEWLSRSYTETLESHGCVKRN